MPALPPTRQRWPPAIAKIQLGASQRRWTVSRVILDPPPAGTRNFGAPDTGMPLTRIETDART